MPGALGDRGDMAAEGAFLRAMPFGAFGYCFAMRPEPRFVRPAKGSRPRGSRLIEMYSVKLGRRVTAYSREQYEILLGAEVDSTVACYCERPTLDGLASDVWEKRSDNEQFAVLTEGSCVDSWMGIRVARISAAELASKQQWLRNWESMLPAVIANRDIADRTLRNDIRRLVTEPMSLAVIERELTVGDPARIRAGIFRLLLEGELKAPGLHDQPLTLATRIGPAS